MQHIIQPLIDLIVPESKDAKAALRQIAITAFVTCIAVLAPIHLDDDLGSQAGEIHDPGTNRHLATETTSVDMASAQGKPQRLFLRRLVSP